MLIDVPADVKDACSRSSISSSSPRTCSSGTSRRRRAAVVRARGAPSGRGRRRGRRLARWCAAEHGNSASFAGTPAIVLAHRLWASPATDVCVGRESLPLAGGSAPRRRCGGVDAAAPTRCASKRACRSFTRHGRGHHPARSRHRSRARSADEGLLRRAGGDHSRAAPRAWTRRAPAGGARRSTATDRRAPATACDRAGGSGNRPRDERRQVAGAGAPIALGYVHRDFVAPGTRAVTVAAEVVQLPFAVRWRRGLK